MSESVVHLVDSSAIVKRYILEPDGEYVRTYTRGPMRARPKSRSAYRTFGKVLGALDRARRLGGLDEEGYRTTRRRFIGETRRMSKTGILILVP